MKNTYLVFLALIVISCSDNFNNRLDSYFSKSFHENEPGGAVLILKGDKVVFSKAYGLADLQTKEKITA